MNCDKCQNLIKKYIEGPLSKTPLKVLNEHLQSCSDCRKEFEACKRIEIALREGLSSETSSEKVRDFILAKLYAQQPTVPKTPVMLLTPKSRLAVAASILLIAGLLLGFYVGKVSSPVETSMPVAGNVPISVAAVEGIVLVKHKDSSSWEQLQPGSDIYIGDTFHSAAKSNLHLVSEDKSLVGLNQNSMLVLKSYNGGTKFHLEHGELKASLESPHPSFVISTPHGRVEALGTEFTISVK